MAELKKKILVIDDDPDTVTFLRIGLEDQGFEAHTASDGREGYEALVRCRPDLVLMDLKMPHQTGLQCYRDIRKHDGFRDLPVIFVTGMGEFQVFAQDCSPLPEPVAKIDKPVDLGILEEAVRRALG